MLCGSPYHLSGRSLTVGPVAEGLPKASAMASMLKAGSLDPVWARKVTARSLVHALHLGPSCASLSRCGPQLTVR